MNKREFVVDFLKAMGTLLVILAHCAPPDWLYHTRVFDVCMLVFASGLTLRWHGKSIKAYLTYITNRFKRLILPTWFFLIVYFGISAVLSLSCEQWSISLDEAVKSFTFTGGIDYIWIIRVYFLLAMISPLIYGLAHSEWYKKHWLPVLVCLLCINEIVAEYSMNIDNEFARKMFQAVFSYTLGYSIIEIVACSIKRIDSMKLFAVITVLFAFFWVSSGMIPPQKAKYPPGAIYILYGLMVSICGYGMGVRYEGRCSAGLKNIIEWISRNSLMLYFCHIIPVTFIHKMGVDQLHFLIKYVTVLSISVILTMLVNKVTSKINRSTLTKEH